MSVDERLRAGLELNASTVAPKGEARLVAVRRRHRRRMAGLALGGVGTVAAGVALAVGLASGGADRAVPPEPAPPVVTPPPAPETAGLIPDSTWRRVVTATEASAGGVSEGRIRDDIGTDGRLPMEMRLTTTPSPRPGTSADPGGRSATAAPWRTTIAADWWSRRCSARHAPRSPSPGSSRAAAWSSSGRPGATARWSRSSGRERGVAPTECASPVNRTRVPRLFSGEGRPAPRPEETPCA